MQTGTIKWYNPTKGYGFIQPDQGGADVFLHATAVERAGMAPPHEGQKLGFQLEEQRGRTSAVALQAV